MMVVAVMMVVTVVTSAFEFFMFIVSQKKRKQKLQNISLDSALPAICNQGSGSDGYEGTDASDV